MVSFIQVPRPPGQAAAPAAAAAASPEGGDTAQPDGFEALMASLVGGAPPQLPPDLGPDRSPEAPPTAVEGEALETDASATEVVEAQPIAPPPHATAAAGVLPASAAEVARTASARDGAPARGRAAALPAQALPAAASARAGTAVAAAQAPGLSPEALPPGAQPAGLPPEALPPESLPPKAPPPAAIASPVADAAEGAGSDVTDDVPVALPTQSAGDRGLGAAPPPGASRADAPPVPTARRPEQARASEVESASARLRPELAATVAQAAGATAVDEPATAGRSSPAVQLADSVELAATRGPRELRVQLRPAELGQITIRVTETDGGLRVVIEAAVGEIEELMLQQLPALRAALEARELRVDRLDVQSAGLGEAGLPEREQPRSGRDRAAEEGQAEWAPEPTKDGAAVAAGQPSNHRVDVRV